MDKKVEQSLVCFKNCAMYLICNGISCMHQCWCARTYVLDLVMFTGAASRRHAHCPKTMPQGLGDGPVPTRHCACESASVVFSYPLVPVLGNHGGVE